MCKLYTNILAQYKRNNKNNISHSPSGNPKDLVFPIPDILKGGKEARCFKNKHLYKLDGEGPVDNSPSIDYLHHFEEEKKEKKCVM